jgi:HPt (histidine-containing phosphotransfer) domain-containing protein
MSTNAADQVVHYSVLAADPVLSEIVTLFIDELPLRLRHMKAHLGCANWDELARLAHQLKGAAGSYGFDQLTPFAARLEKAVRGGEHQAAVAVALDDLAAVCQCVRAGTPPPEHAQPEE